MKTQTILVCLAVCGCVEGVAPEFQSAPEPEPQTVESTPPAMTKEHVVQKMNCWANLDNLQISYQTLSNGPLGFATCQVGGQAGAAYYVEGESGSGRLTCFVSTGCQDPRKPCAYWFDAVRHGEARITRVSYWGDVTGWDMQCEVVK